MADAEAERQLLAAIAGAPPDTGFDSATLGWEASVLVGLIKSLESAELVTAKARRRVSTPLRCPPVLEDAPPCVCDTLPATLTMQAVDHVRWAVTAEGREYVAGGTPEARVWDAAGGAGVPLADLKARDTGGPCNGRLDSPAHAHTAPDHAGGGRRRRGVQAGHGAEGREVEQRRRARRREAGASPACVRVVVEPPCVLTRVCSTLAQADVFTDTVRQQLAAVDQGQVLGGARCQIWAGVGGSPTDARAVVSMRRRRP